MRNKHVVAWLLAGYVGLLYSKKITFVTADLGRHLQNGRLFIEQGIIPHTNFYSYTMPDFPVVTHHWGSGVVLYVVFLIGGFIGISVFHAVLAGIAGYLWFRIAVQVSNIQIAALSFLCAIPLLVNRVEVRPEIFSTIFLGLYIWILMRARQEKYTLRRLLAIFLPLQIIWVNMHVFFILGYLAVFVFLTESLIKRSFHAAKRQGILLFSLIGSSFISPFGIAGVLEPFTILREYGYMIVENQSVLFMQKRTGDGIYLYFEALAGVLGLLWILYRVKAKNASHSLPFFLLSLFFIILAFRYIRTLPLFGYVFILCSSFLIHDIVSLYRIKKEYISYALGILIALIVWIGLGFGTAYAPWRGHRFGYGVADGIHRSADFFVQSGIDGPVFNNYDIGGYLVYHLYPSEKVFVDNRPEAYSVEFFQNEYIPAQESEDAWTALDKKYSFNAIYFYRHDQTPWAQPFLIRRIEGSAWVPMYVDAYTILLLRNIDANSAIIEQHALPRELFTVRSSPT